MCSTGIDVGRLGVDRTSANSREQAGPGGAVVSHQLKPAQAPGRHQSQTCAEHEAVESLTFAAQAVNDTPSSSCAQAGPTGGPTSPTMDRLLTWPSPWAHRSKKTSQWPFPFCEAACEGNFCQAPVR